MKKLLNYTLMIVITCLNSLTTSAQKKTEMADAMRSNGKIYVVVVVCLIILTGLFLYAFKLDRELKKIEK